MIIAMNLGLDVLNLPFMPVLKCFYETITRVSQHPNFDPETNYTLKCSVYRMIILFLAYKFSIIILKDKSLHKDTALDNVCVRNMKYCMCSLLLSISNVFRITHLANNCLVLFQG